MKLLPIEKKIINNCRELDQLLEDNLGLRELAEKWLGLGREYALDLVNGVDDDEKFVTLGLILKKGPDLGREDIAELYYDISEARKFFSEIKLVEDYVVKNPHIKKYDPSFWLDEEKLDQIEEEMGFYYDDELCSQANTFDRALPFMLMHAMSEGGGASIHNPADDFFEDMVMSEDDDVPEDFENILYCHSYIRDIESGFGLNGCCYFRRGKSLVDRGS